MSPGSLDGSVRLVCRTQHMALATVSPHSAPVTAIMIDTPLDVKVGHYHVIINHYHVIINHHHYLLSERSGQTARVHCLQVNTGL